MSGFHLTRGSASLISILAPLVTLVLVMIVVMSFVPESDSLFIGLYVSAYIAGILLRLYCARWYVLDKRRESGWATLALLGLIGWIFLWTMKDLSTQPHLGS